MIYKNLEKYIFILFCYQHDGKIIKEENLDGKICEMLKVRWQRFQLLEDANRGLSILEEVVSALIRG